MARGLPGVWSSLLSLPFLASGAYVHYWETPYPELLGAPLLAFGGFVLLTGWYIHLVAAPSTPTLRDSETVVDTRHPTQKAALTKMLFALPLLSVAAYLLFFSTVPYVYPTAPFVAGLYLFSTGILTYWTNSLTTYTITTRRVISEFRLLSLVRTEVPMDKIRAVRESRSPVEALVGVGNVRVSSGTGTDLEVLIRNVDGVSAFAEQLRRQT